MTNVTMSELKMIFIELILIGIVGGFMVFYDMSPIPASATGTGLYNPSIPQDNIYNQSSVSPTATEGNWIITLISDTLGLPIEKAEIIIVSLIVLVPLTIMNGFTAIRLIKDLATQWV